MTRSLCINCDNTSSCVMKNGHPVLQCEEHVQVQPVELMAPVEPIQIADSNSKPTPHFEGLCITCDLLDDCAWQKANVITFHCEHYQ